VVTNQTLILESGLWSLGLVNSALPRVPVRTLASAQFLVFVSKGERGGGKLGTRVSEGEWMHP
jgi:hypothetical protein